MLWGCGCKPAFQTPSRISWIFFWTSKCACTTVNVWPYVSAAHQAQSTDIWIQYKIWTKIRLPKSTKRHQELRSSILHSRYSSTNAGFLLNYVKPVPLQFHKSQLQIVIKPCATGLCLIIGLDELDLLLFDSCKYPIYTKRTFCIYLIAQKERLLFIIIIFISKRCIVIEEWPSSCTSNGIWSIRCTWC